jgi:tRNA1Val (adenine37-N6)-methyltransferase
MSNTYFRFKQFTIQQDRCAMKVTTDACIQGAWTPIRENVKQVLDAGAGTGLLSLMLVQRNADIYVDAIELDKDAAAQAKENIQASPWGSRVNVSEGDVCTYSFTCRYDLIISNPPFFNNSLLSNNASKDMARHTLQLTYEGLLQVCEQCLDDNGYISIMLPPAEYKQWQALAERHGMFEQERLTIQHKKDSPVIRVVGLFGKKQMDKIDETKLVIRETEENYSKEFTDLLAPFYLYL